MSKLVSLSDLVSINRDPDHSIFESSNAVMNWRQWQLRVALWSKTFALRDEQCWGVFHSDSAECSAIIFALWLQSKTVCLLSGQQPEFLVRAEDDVDGFVGEFEHYSQALQKPCETINASDEDLLASIDSLTINKHEPLLKVYTSGSSGVPELVPKNLRQLDGELQHLHSQWSIECDNLLILATVSHQHFYGFIFRVLWPLCEGWCAYTEICGFWEDVIEKIQDRPFILATSPTHLTRMPDIFSQKSFEKCLKIFSSGALLDRAASLNARSILSTVITEIYGSTETGGVAWREQSLDDDGLWQALVDVELDIDQKDNCLSVRSSLLPLEREWYTTADRVEFHENGFRLLGRVDRVVKIEGKRLSLDEMERSLRSLAVVQDVRLLVLTGRRVEVGAVILLNEEGQKALSESGPLSMNKYVKNGIEQYFDRPLLPRRFRYVSQLPINTQGKVTHDNLKQLFLNVELLGEVESTVDNNSSKPTQPVELSCKELSSKSIHLSYRVPKDLLYFEGHFNKNPILPGVVQVSWVEEIARKKYAIKGEFLRLDAIKFQKVIFPGQQFNLAILYKPEKSQINFTISSELGNHASGRIVFSEAGASDE